MLQLEKAWTYPYLGIMLISIEHDDRVREDVCRIFTLYLG